jgi:hypothetical protein
MKNVFLTKFKKIYQNSDLCRLEFYFKKIYESLSSTYGVTSLEFCKFFDIPLPLAQRIFTSLKIKPLGTLPLDYFCEFFKNLYLYKYADPIETVFSLFDCRNCGYISGDDVKSFLFLLCSSTKYLDIIIESILKLFEKKACIGYFDFYYYTVRINSDLFFIVLFYLFSKKPFNEEIFEYISNGLNIYSECFVKDVILPSDLFYKFIEYIYNDDNAIIYRNMIFNINKSSTFNEDCDSFDCEVIVY